MSAEVETRDVAEADRLGGHAAPALPISSRSELEEGLVGEDTRPGGGAFQEQRPEVLAVPLAPDQIAQVLAGAAEAAGGDLLVHEGLQAFREGDVHRGHGETVGAMAKFGKGDGVGVQLL